MQSGKSGEEDVLWIIRVADLEKGVNQCTLPVGLKCNVEVNDARGSCVA